MAGVTNSPLHFFVMRQPWLVADRRKSYETSAPRMTSSVKLLQPSKRAEDNGLACVVIDLLLRLFEFEKEVCRANYDLCAVVSDSHPLRTDVSHLQIRPHSSQQPQHHSCTR